MDTKHLQAVTIIIIWSRRLNFDGKLLGYSGTKNYCYIWSVYRFQNSGSFQEIFFSFADLYAEIKTFNWLKTLFLLESAKKTARKELIKITAVLGHVNQLIVFSILVWQTFLSDFCTFRFSNE